MAREAVSGAEFDAADADFAAVLHRLAAPFGIRRRVRRTSDGSYRIRPNGSVLDFPEYLPDGECASSAEDYPVDRLHDELRFSGKRRGDRPDSVSIRRLAPLGGFLQRQGKPHGEATSIARRP